MDWVNGFLNPLVGGLPNVVQAVLLLLVAWVVAALIRFVLVKVLKKVFSKKIAAKSADGISVKEDSLSIIGKIVFAVVFCLFLPGALDKLGMTNVSAPITQMVTSFLGFIPNIVAAIIILAFGIFISKLVMQVISGLLKKTKIDSLQKKWGIKNKKGAGLSDIISKFIYFLILIIFVVAAIQVLNISAISAPATAVIDQIFDIIPSLFVAIILIVFGVFLGNLVGKLLESILSGTGMDNYVAGILPVKEGKNPMSASVVIAGIVRVVVDIIFIVAAINVLNIKVLSTIGESVIAYLPQILAAAVILILAWIAGGWIQKLILSRNEEAKTMAVSAKAAIVILALFMALSQLGIADSIVNTLFIAVVAAAGIATAIAFGIGGKDFAKKTLDKIASKNNDENSSDKK